MTSGTISLIIIGLFIFVLLVGFLFGLARGFSKSLIRVFMVLGMLVIAFFITNMVTDLVLNFNIYNMNITVGGERASTVGGALQNLLNQIEAIKEISDTPAYQTIMEVVPKMIVNVVMFVVIFYLLRLVSLIIYWIIAGVAFSKKKTEGKNKHRLLGSIVGVVQNFVIFLVLLIPVFGAVNIFGQVEQITTAETTAETTASSIAEDKIAVLMTEEGSGEEAETEQKQDSQIEKTYKKINEVIGIYKETWVSKFLSGVKLDKVCLTVFNKLSTVEKDGTKYSLETESKNLATLYVDVKDFTKVALDEDHKLDFTNPETITSLKKIIDHAYNSKLTGDLIDQVIPLAIQKWNNGEKFLGMAKPEIENYQDVLDGLLAKLNTNESKKALLLSTADMIGSLIKTAQTVQDASGEVTPETIGTLLEELASNENIQELAQDIILPKIDDIAKQILPVDEQVVDGETVDVNEEYRDIITEVATSIISADYSEGSGNDITKEAKVIEQAISIYQKLEDSEQTVTEDDAKAIVEALSDSTVIADELEKSSSALASTIQEQLDAETKEMIKTQINNLENVDAEKIIQLKAIFGITE